MTSLINWLIFAHFWNIWNLCEVSFPLYCQHLINILKINSELWLNILVFKCYFSFRTFYVPRSILHFPSKLDYESFMFAIAHRIGICFVFGELCLYDWLFVIKRSFLSIASSSWDTPHFYVCFVIGICFLLWFPFKRKSQFLAKSQIRVKSMLTLLV